MLFTVPVAVLASPNLNLVFHGIDTAANISLNGRKILTTDNMFLRYVVDVRGVLNEGDNNNLTVAIQSPIFYSLMKFSEFYQNNYTVYPTSHPASQNGEEHANFIRKMQVYYLRLLLGYLHAVHLRIGSFSFRKTYESESHILAQSHNKIDHVLVYVVLLIADRHTLPNRARSAGTGDQLFPRRVSGRASNWNTMTKFYCGMSSSEHKKMVC